jgi:2-iminobutanoate/2-iminopropanoate deaminase
MTRIPVNTADAAVVGPYSPAIDSDPYVYLSGQTPIDPATGGLHSAKIEDQTLQCLRNLAVVLDAAGLDETDVVKCNVYLIDMEDFSAMNAAYASFFSTPHPARTTVAVAGLPLGARVEIEMVARRR